MKKMGILFCGQGSQAVGMGQELCANFASAREVFACGSDILGMSLQKVCFAGDGAALAQTQAAQPAIYAVALAGYLVLRDELGIVPAALAGHSLGEYGALTAAGVYTPENGFRVIKARGEAMGRAARGAKGKMAAVIGSDEATVEKVCAETQGYVLPVNYNAPQQTVIAGEADAVDAAAEVFAGMGLRVAPLAVAGAFHTELMRPAADEFAAEIAGIAYAQPSLPFYSNRTGERMEHFDNLPAYLHAHMVSPVLFTRQLAAMQRDGCEAYIEAGPGKVISGLVKRTVKGAKPLSVEDAAGVEKVRACLSR